MVRRSTVVVISAVMAWALGAIGLTERSGGTSPPHGSQSPPAVRALDASTSSPGAVGAPSGPGERPFACPDLAAPGEPAMSPPGSATRLFTRTTDDGVALRVYATAPMPAVLCGPVSSQGTPANPTSECDSRSVMVEMSDASTVGQGVLDGVSAIPVMKGSSTTSGITTPAASVPQALTSGVFGVIEGDPTWWVAASLGTEVAEATITFADGSSDDMAPIGGVVVLAHHAAATTPASDLSGVRGTLTLSDASGNVLATVALVDVSSPVAVPPPGPVIGPLSAPGGAAGSASFGTGTEGAGAGGSASTATGTSPPNAPMGCLVVPVAPTPRSLTPRT